MGSKPIASFYAYTPQVKEKQQFELLIRPCAARTAAYTSAGEKKVCRRTAC